MATILIVEGNTPEMVAAGHAGANGYVSTFAAVSPETHLRIANPYSKALTDADFDGVDGVILTGSGVSWSVDDIKAAPQRTAMEDVLASHLPVWGSCNGLQLAMLVLGGAIGVSPIGIEFGLARDVSLTNAGREHPMMARRAPRFDAPCIHRDEVQALPDGATLLAGNDHSRVQAVAYQRDGICVWGTQYHPELSLPEIGLYLGHGSIFADFSGLADDLQAAEMDAAAASRLGTSQGAVVLPVRCRELVNWLQFVTGG